MSAERQSQRPHPGGEWPVVFVVVIVTSLLADIVSGGNRNFSLIVGIGVVVVLLMRLWQLAMDRRYVNRRR